jgi:hypothetical protein
MSERPDIERAAESLLAAQKSLESAAAQKENASQQTQLQLLAEEVKDIYVRLELSKWRLDASE